ncbi:anthranilate synthase component I [Chloroherpeton thalassium ATCC 35110]|uniref:Anthranilate synthase component 1 n=1 Tax=Chloroherpeton thalassium (strain ATCC 35110 / GB-78) TaxID=517418 RepID=B3QV06_CHLT3|nr:anthranilate synthase component I [Chloroherpeton thalassium]ACF14507.1 anthranilate synthase component I [Chloroherpeton thalassium ATCC 35110]
MQDIQCNAKNHKPEQPIFNFQVVWEELLADTETPVSVYLKLQSKYSCLLESVEGEDFLARFSYIGVRPFAIFRAWLDNAFEIDILDEKYSALKNVVEGETDIRKAVEKSLGACNNFSKINGNLNRQMMTSGAFGFFGYDTLHLVEEVPKAQAPDPANLPDILLMFYDTLVVFDNIKRKIFIVSNYLDEAGKAEAHEKISALKEQIFTPLTKAQIALEKECEAPVYSNTEREAYLEKVRTAKEYIKAGDIFQVQISQRLRRELNTRPFDVYRMLRTINPSPYLFYFELEDAQIVGSSPELLVKVEKNSAGERVVETRPIAGTRPRGKSPEADAEIAKELLSDEKERAEHLMLIDLSRNDVGRIAKIGSVKTTEMMVIERYSHVMHIVSNVEGYLRDEFSPMDAFWACFPAGTLTGAPKIRAMEIIYELEKEKRGIYGGAVGYFDFNGNLNTAIAIRTMVVKGKTIYFQAAGGIVADSKPENEYEETMNKMRAGLRTVEKLVSGE